MHKTTKEKFGMATVFACASIDIQSIGNPKHN